MEKLEPIYKPRDFEPMRLAISMSGSGSNARKIIERHLYERSAGRPSFVPVFMFTDNPDSNAVNIGTKKYMEKGFSVPVLCDSVHGFYAARGHDDIRNMKLRSEFDNTQVKAYSAFSIDCVALAGDDRIKTPALCNAFLMINVHPGDLRVKNESGRPKYIGLGWVPSAKAILAGENEVHSSVHLVTSNVDEGSLLAVSASQPVPDEVKSLSLEQRAKLLGRAGSINEIFEFTKENPDFPEPELFRQYPIVKHASDCQNRLKENGDWVIFPNVVSYISQGKYARDEKGRLYFDEKPIPNGVEWGDKK